MEIGIGHYAALYNCQYDDVSHWRVFLGIPSVGTNYMLCCVDNLYCVDNVGNKVFNGMKATV